MSVVAPKKVLVTLVVFTLFMISLAAAREVKSGPLSKADPLRTLVTTLLILAAQPFVGLVCHKFCFFTIILSCLMALILDFRRPRMHQGAKHVLTGRRIPMTAHIVAAN